MPTDKFSFFPSLSFCTRTRDSAHQIAHQSLLAGHKNWKHGWGISLSLINQTCVSVGVQLKRSEPGSLQNTAHLCFRLQAVWDAPLSHLYLRLGDAFLSHGYRVVKVMNSFKKARINNNDTFLEAGSTLSDAAWLLLMNANPRNLLTYSQSKQACLSTYRLKY